MSWFDDEDTSPGDHSPPPAAEDSHESRDRAPGGESTQDGRDRRGDDAPDRGVSWGVGPGPGLWPWGRRARARRARRGQAKAALSERARRLREAGEADSNEDPPVLTQPWRQVPARQNLRVLASLVTVVAVVVGLAWWMSSRGDTADPADGARAAAIPPPRPAVSSEPAGVASTAPGSAAGGPAAGEAPDVVCRRFATMYLAADAADDATPAAARQRAAARYGTRELQRDLAADQTERTQPSWQQLQKHQAHTETTPRPYAGAAPPPDGAGIAHAAVTVTRTAVGADGWSQTLPTATVYCTLSRADTVWRVNQVDLSLGGPA